MFKYEYDVLIAEFNPPADWHEPKWQNEDRVHNWRNYASEGIIREWPFFTGKQKIIISSMLDDIAGQEHWD